jgi:Tfp pilus assembly protein PilN
VNLIPSEVVESKSARKQALMIAASGVLVFVLMIFAMLILNIRGKMQHKTLQEKKQSQLRRNNQTLKNEEKWLNEHLSTVSGDLENISKALASGSFIKWGVILQDISLATPKVVRITNLTTDDNMNVLLAGQALSYQAVDLFVQKLNESEHITSASLLAAQKDNGSSYVVSYTINCSLVQ